MDAINAQLATKPEGIGGVQLLRQSGRIMKLCHWVVFAFLRAARRPMGYTATDAAILLFLIAGSVFGTLLCRTSHAQTCTSINSLGTLSAPTNAAQMVYAPDYGRLIIKNTGSAIAVIDTANGQSTWRFPVTTFSDVVIAPSGRYIFGADYGGENIGYGTPASTSYVHRLDLASTTWDTRTVYIAGGIQAISDEKFILKSNDQWVTFTNNAWGSGPAAIQLNSSGGVFSSPAYYASVYRGEFRYDISTGRLLHGNSGSSSREIQAFRIANNEFLRLEGSGTYGSADGYGDTSALATDGSAFYYGKLQVDPLDVTFNRRVFADPIYAATGTVAFGNGNLFDSRNGNLLATLGFPTTVYALNPNGTDFWAFDASQNMLHHLNLVAAPCGTPAAPVGVNASVAPGSKNIVLNWTGITGATGYNVYFAKQPGVTKTNYLSIGGQQRANVTSPTTLAGMPAGTYYLIVTAFNNSGESVESAPVSVNVPDTQPPDVPSGLAAKVINSSSVALTWTASIDDVAVNYYEIFQNDFYRGIVFAPQASFTDSNLLPQTSYSYSIRACDTAFNCSARSASVNVVTPVKMTPDPYAFPARTSVPRSTVVTSNTITISGLGTAVPISVIGGEYSIGGGAFTSNPGTVSNGQNVVVRVTSSAAYAATVGVTLTIGDSSATFNVTTLSLTITSAPYFPLALGNRWVTRRNGAQDAEVTVTNPLIVIGSPTMGVTDAGDGSIQYLSNDTLGVRMHRTFSPSVFVAGCGNASETDTYSPPLPIISPNAIQGQTQNSFGVVTSDLGACGSYQFSYFATTTFQNIERVSVPAGQFDAIKVETTLTIGGLASVTSANWFAPGIGLVKALVSDGTLRELVSTNVVRTSPDQFSFVTQVPVPPDAFVISAPAIISGITAPAAVTVSGGEYSVEGAAFTSQAGTVTNGQNVRVRVRSSTLGNVSTSATITIGGVAGTFTVITGAVAPGAPMLIGADVGAGSIAVRFNPPQSNGGAEIAEYKATCVSSNGGASGSGLAFGGSTVIRVNGLTIGKSYTCSVTATNAAGTSSASAASTSVTPFDITPILQLLME